MPWDHHRRHANRRRGAHQRTEVVGILDLIEHQHGTGAGCHDSVKILIMVGLGQCRHPLVGLAAGQASQGGLVRVADRNASLLRGLRELRAPGGVAAEELERANRGRLDGEATGNGIDAVQPVQPLAAPVDRARVYNLPPVHYDSSTVKILDRYILRELIVPFVTGLGVFTSILLIVRILKLVELVVNRGVPIGQILLLFSYILPAFLEVTVPMALLLAILVAFGRLSSDSELIALRAAGISLYRLLVPVAGFASIVAILTLGLSLYARPWGNSLLRTGLYNIIRTRAVAGIKPKIFNDEFSGLVIYVDHIEPATDELAGILISDTREPSIHNTVYAESGRLVSNENHHTLTLRMENGGIYSAGAERHDYQDTRFATYDITLDLDTALTQLRNRSKDADEMTLPELREAIAAKAAQNDEAFVERVEVQRKFSIPFACLVFAALGVPLGIQPSRSVHSRGFSMSLVLIFVYYLLLTFGQNLGERGALAPVIAVWLPNAVLSVVATVLLARAAREAGRRPPLWDRLAALLRQRTAWRGASVS
jgi:lipopolysaccharide export system permease protein